MRPGGEGNLQLNNNHSNRISNIFHGVMLRTTEINAGTDESLACKIIDRADFIIIPHLLIGKVIPFDLFLVRDRSVGHPSCKNLWCFFFAAQVLLFFYSLYCPLFTLCFTLMMSFTSFYTEDNPDRSKN